ncbi:hypothetical protein ERX35_007010 [Macrococcus equipercicus]|uniref:Uncharacterized protein n=1 Tax=Macrococcus equipercicus TaxID=69967 RepID=A0ABQ6R880_9STAP|nr:hypothetical protein [Macrococcus equipercicus]KAA1039315.1 hypothetical protein ERX35_007010 [Macrococcus equipercicus]
MTNKLIVTVFVMTFIAVLLNKTETFAKEVGSENLLLLGMNTGRIDINALTAAFIISLIGGIYIIVERKRER